MAEVAACLPPDKDTGKKGLEVDKTEFISFSVHFILKFHYIQMPLK